MLIAPAAESENAHYKVHSEAESSAQMTVFCDLDGPIVDVSDRYYTTYKQGLADTQEVYLSRGINLSLEILSKQQFWQMKQNRVPDTEIAKSSGLGGEEIPVFLACVSRIVNQPDLLHLDRIQPGVQWAIALLHSRGVRLVLVTLRPKNQAVQILQNYGLARLFTSICGTQMADAAYHNYTALKTELLAEVAEEYQSSLGSAWMIGDTEADILAGQALGIPTIAVTCGIRSRHQLQQYQPSFILSDLIIAVHHLLGFKRFL
ncbi:MAG: HAD family hydrolase [Microcoleus anatoxicus]|uniref:HAD family hydrolase n=1 Tax=Microcoleus anatoxicus TaxID=2705319 RepID=UPI00366B425A